MTDDVIDALIADGNLNVVSIENADAVLTGELVRYERKPYQFTENDVVTTYSVIMDFEIVLKKADSDAEIWKERISQTGTYLVDSETEEDGQQKAIGFLVEAIINKTTKSW
ncbi:MAG: LPS assembly lipoprotein LptE, partial [bacterium]